MVLNSKFWQSSPSEDAKIFLVNDNVSLTFEQAFIESDNLFQFKKRDVVLILCRKNIETVISYLGALRNGLIPLLVDESIKHDSLQRILESYKPRYICHHESLDYLFAKNKILSKEKFLGYELITVEAQEKDINKELALLILTSGSTGDPKSVRISYNNIQVATHSICQYLDLNSHRVSFSMLPFHYSYGLSVVNNALFSRSKFLITNLGVLDKGLWQKLLEHKVTDLSGVPFTFEMMSRMKLEYIYNNLECLTQAGGRLEPRFTKHFLELSKRHQFKYFTMYGQTEASPRISYVPYEKALEKIGSVGIPISCGKVSLRYLDDQESTGELIYEGENVCMGYAESCNDLNRRDDFNGRLFTGDIAQISEDGFISIIGRLKRFIKLKGSSVNLDYLEKIINQKGVKSLVIGEDDRLIVVIEDYDKNLNLVHSTIDGNLNAHKSLIKVVGYELPYLSSGKPDYQLLEKIFLHK